MELRQEDLRILYAACVRRLGAAGEDAAQLAAILILRSGRPLPLDPGPRGGVLRWYARLAVARERYALRQWGRAAVAAREAQILAAADEERDERRALLAAAWASLSAEERDTIAAWSVCGLERHAAAQGIPRGTVYARVRPAFAALRAAVRRVELRGRYGAGDAARRQ